MYSCWVSPWTQYPCVDHYGPIICIQHVRSVIQYQRELKIIDYHQSPCIILDNKRHVILIDVIFQNQVVHLCIGHIKTFQQSHFGIV